jgi:hypothetical protein
MPKDQKPTANTTANQPHKGQQEMPPLSGSTNPLVAAPHAKDEPSSTKNSPEDKPLPRPAGPEWVIVYITAIYVFIAGWTLLAIKRQADFMEQQTGILRESVTAAKTTADAAKASAEATKENVEIFISKDRARIRVELEDLKLEPLLDDRLFHQARYRVELHGSTEAFIVDTLAYAYVSNSPVPDYSEFNPPMGIPWVIKPASPVIESSTFLWRKIETPSSEIEREITQRKSFAHFHGFIRYNDVFERERETKFRYIWNVVDRADGTSFAYWKRCGTEDDNAET